MLFLKNICVTMGKQTPLERAVLQNLTLEVQKGELILIKGANGAGKSTLFNVISGVTSVDSGQIVLDGQDVTRWSPYQRSLLVAKVLQNPRSATMGEMTIEENLSFAFKRGRKRGFVPCKNKDRYLLFQEKLSCLRMGLENRLSEFTKNLSGGERQALSLVMALMGDSKILLLDEITAALDPYMSETLMQMTTKMIHEEKRTALMITHNLSHMEQYGDRTLVLKDGILS